MLSYSDTLWQTVIPNSHKRLPFSYLATWMLVLSRVKYLLPLKEEKWTPPGQNFCFDKTEVAPFPGLKRFQFMEMRSLAELNEKQLSKGRQRTDLWIRSIHRIHNHTTKDDFQWMPWNSASGTLKKSLMSLLRQSPPFFTSYPSSVFVISLWVCSKAFELWDSGKRTQERRNSLAVQWLGLSVFTAVASFNARSKKERKVTRWKVSS